MNDSVTLTSHFRRQIDKFNDEDSSDIICMISGRDKQLHLHREILCMTSLTLKAVLDKQTSSTFKLKEGEQTIEWTHPRDQVTRFMNA